MQNVFILLSTVGHLKLMEFSHRNTFLTGAPCVVLNENLSKNSKVRSLRKVNCNPLVKWSLKRQKRTEWNVKSNKSMYRINTKDIYNFENLLLTNQK
jgi:hypothetical protein